MPNEKGEAIREYNVVVSFVEYKKKFLK